MKVDALRKPPWLVAFSFPLVTAVLFGLSWYGQFFFQAKAALAEAEQHDRTVDFGDYVAQFWASTFENWQSEFLQLVWQAVGLAVFYCWGSSQSREGTDRLEAKVNLLLRRQGIDPDTLR